MKANYNTAHGTQKERIYNAMADVFFTAIAFYLSDKRGWKAHRIVKALTYINNVIIDLNGDEVKFKDLKETLKDEIGIVIEQKPKGIHVYVEGKNEL